uniref:hypothetical protein n=1 Tax=Ornithobacterium rhinotracheale TaxID=28251 RepID=UPI00129C79A3|nr:hypothetical protein [Ornithobacterium rhinotracheale]
MKRILLAFVCLFCLTSCSSNVTDVAGFEFNNAWYWVYNYNEGTTKEELVEIVKNHSNPEQTSYFFFYPENKDVSVFASEPFNLISFSQTIVADKPDYGFYKMPNDAKIYDDGIWLLEQSLK